LVHRAKGFKVHMGNRIYVGNLSEKTTDDDLRLAFAPHGLVVSANVMVDRATRRSRGFGFVEMATEELAQAAIAAMNGQMLDGQALTVNEAKAREARGGAAGAGGFRGGSGGGRNYGGVDAGRRGGAFGGGSGQRRGGRGGDR
jgi:RNA recognition motif-containing protein